MKDQRIAWRFVAAALFCLLVSLVGYAKDNERVSLRAEKGTISFVAEVAKPPAGRPGTMSVHLTVEKGRVNLIGENGMVVGYIGENGRVNLASGIKSLNLVDSRNRTVGTAGQNGNIRMVIRDCGRIALIGENGRSIGHIAENGLVKFQE